ncbi:hypothetical protein BDN72DRAFT_828091 [Pluteus cervinus]|uniref:Uncharacterized protein n=1 Tax=Pluteus cervinus TaxID=181527 RepID=A0ACD3A7Q0_9AGAR|nr:hypothetical protein BDN72DRAFT_828091 [Pluteus cervinus]
MGKKRSIAQEECDGALQVAVAKLPPSASLNMQNADVYYVEDFIEKAVADDWYKELLDLDTWYQPTLKLYGKSVIQSRKIAAYSTDPNFKLKYSGQLVDMHYEYPPLLRDIQGMVEKRLGVTFNHVMLNLYEDGSVYIGNHRDNMENRVIASLSLGTPRTFVMTYDPLQSALDSSESAPPKKRRRKQSNAKSTAVADQNPKSATPNNGETSEPAKPEKRVWTLANGSLVVMQGVTQRFWKHSIPKETKIKGGRISLTFRQLDTDNVDS